MPRGCRSWLQYLINVWTMPATMSKIKLCVTIHSQCSFCKLKILFMFKTFVSSLSGHASYIQYIQVFKSEKLQAFNLAFHILSHYN